ncbi:MAG: hypothetical protein R6V50_07545 [Thermoplasmatota archaeon]
MVKITACPNCGSKDIKMGSLGDGVLYGIGSWKQVCKRCGYQGAPLVFDSVEEYKEYYESLHRDTKNSDFNKKNVLKKDQEVFEYTDHMNEKDKDNLIKTEAAEEKRRWNVFVISIVISIVLTVVFMPYYFDLFEPFFAMIALVGAFISFLFFTFLILMFLVFLFKPKKL